MEKPRGEAQRGEPEGDTAVMEDPRERRPLWSRPRGPRYGGDRGSESRDGEAERRSGEGGAEGETAVMEETRGRDSRDGEKG